MPVGVFRNNLYGAALALLGKPSLCTDVSVGGPDNAMATPLLRILRRRHVVGAAIQRLEKGALAECYTAGFARQGPSPIPATPDTLFRTASIAKLATALLVFRLQTLGKLNVDEALEAYLGYPVRNPFHKDVPITLGMLLSHTSSVVDSAAYFSAFREQASLSALLRNPTSFSSDKPGARFRYSNFAAGMIACLLEARFLQSFEALAQEYLFQPLGLRATFDISTLQSAPVADGYRVLPPARKPSFDAAKRMADARPLLLPQPESHYLLASGNLYVSAPDLARLIIPIVASTGFLDEHSLRQLQTPLGQWPDHDVPLGHGMGLLVLEDPRVSSRLLYGHQGFAYGAVNGVFFTPDGDGFVSLCSGGSEQRLGHLARLNRDLIRLFLS